MMVVFSKSCDWLLVFRNMNTKYCVSSFNPLKGQPHKMVKHTQTIRRQIDDELFECVWPFCGVAA